MESNSISYATFFRRTVLFSFFSIIAFLSINAQPYTIFTTGESPTIEANDAGGPIEVGIKFQTTADGIINAIRFFKATGDAGTHVGSIWDYTADPFNPTLLGSVTFTGETASGWQEMTLAPSVAVSSGNTYVVSINNSDVWYTYTTGYFDPAGANAPTGTLDRTPLLALGSGVDGGNGLFETSVVAGTPTFPSNGSFTFNNYWVDVSFTPNSALPVTLTDFKATTSGENNVVLTWETASEQNNKGFEIQRSNNGSNWYPISFVNADGESSVQKNYSFTDKQLAPGNYYYRLNQQDFDGKSKLSPIVTATISGKGAVSLLPAYPNPIKGTGSIRFDLPVAENIRLSIVDFYGREIKLLENKKADKGSHLVNFTTEGLSKQLYYIRLQTENGILTRKIIIQ